MDWSSQVVLISGGTGSFGKKFIQRMLSDYHPAKLIEHAYGKGKLE